MEESNAKKKLRNFAIVEGYLRENYLRTGISNTGKTYISGDVVVAMNRFNSQRVHVFAFALNYDGSENKAYKNLLALLDEKVVTIASYVKGLGDDGVNIDALDEKVWEGATKVATKAWFSGNLEEYATISSEGGNERETSTFSVRANKGAIRRDNDSHPFSPRCKVELDGSILGIRPETKRNGDEMEETGRVIVDYLWIDYKGTGHKFKLIATNDSIDPKKPNGMTYAAYVGDNYEVGNTAQFDVAIVNLVEKKEDATKKASGWGQSVSEVSVTTKFVHELRIRGGRSTTGLDEDSDLYVPKQAATDAITKRRVLAKENWERAQSRKGNAAPVQKPEVKGFGPDFGNNGGDAFPIPDFSDF